VGFRTVICLYNDQMHEWSRDPQLGSLISQASTSLPMGEHPRISDYGCIWEVTHADTQRLAVLDSYGMSTLATGHWSTANLQKQRDLALLKQAAEKLGYKLVKA
jgi:hypothetical protein